MSNQQSNGGLGLAEAMALALEVDDLTIGEIRQLLAGQFDGFALALVRPLLDRDRRFRATREGRWSLASRVSTSPAHDVPREVRSRPATPPRPTVRPSVSVAVRREVDDDTLVSFEERLRQRLRGVQLIAEIGLDEALHEEICAVARRARRRLHGDNLKVAQQFPAIFCCHLVGHGAFDYEAGRYWSIPAAEGYDNQSCGPAFTMQLARLGLANLREIDRIGAMRYVSRILAHGGIPQYCVGDFITLLDRSLGRYGNAATELLSAWTTMSSTFVNLDAPIGRFLTMGGEFAVDYLDRCIDVLTDVIDGDSAGLPAYLVAALLRERGTSSPSRTSQSTARPRPYLELDPWDFDGPVLVLPAVPPVWADASWLVTDSDGTRRLPTSVTTDRIVSVGPSNRWEIALRTASGELVGSTIVAGLAHEDPPILLFDVDTGRLLAGQQPLDGDDVLVLHTEGTVQGRQQFASFGSSWSGYTASVVDLEGLDELTIGGRSWPIRRQVRPRLEGSPVTGIIGANGAAVYASTPALWLPPESVWTITTDVNGERVRHTSSELVADGDGLVRLPMQAPVATVTLRVQGPLGSDLRETFVVVDGLSLERSDRIALPGEQPLAYSLTAAPGVLLDGGTSARGTVEAGENVARPKVHVTDGQGTALDLHVDLPVLSWQWVGSAALGAGAFTSERIIDGTLRGLRGSLGRPDVSVALELHSPRGQEQVVTGQTRLAAGAFSFPLGAFADSLRSLSDTNLKLMLRVGARPVPVASVRPELLVDRITVRSTVTVDQVTVHLAFTQNRNLNGRLVRFWPLYRPWEPPVEREMPDGNQTTASFAFDPSELPPGRYRVHVGLADWSVASLPTASSTNAVDVWVGDQNQVHERVGLRDPLIRRPGEIVLEHMLQTGTRREDLDDQQQPTVSALGPAGLAAMAEHLPYNHRGHAMLEVAAVVGADPRAALVGALELAGTSELSPVQRIGLQAALSSTMQFANQPTFAAELMEQLWRSLPILAVCVNRNAGPHSLARVRMVEHLRLEEAPDHTADDDTGSAQTPTRPPIELVPQLRAVSQHELELSVERLSLLALHLGLRGRPPVFSTTGQQLAQFEWLTAGANGTVDLEAFYTQWRRRIPIEIEDPLLANHVSARVPQRALLHAGLPALSLAAAETVTRRDSGADASLEFLLELARFAPLLVEHDLCLAALSAGHPIHST